MRWPVSKQLLSNFRIVGQGLQLFRLFHLVCLSLHLDHPVISDGHKSSFFAWKMSHGDSFSLFRTYNRHEIHWGFGDVCASLLDILFICGVVISDIESAPTFVKSGCRWHIHWALWLCRCRPHIRLVEKGTTLHHLRIVSLQVFGCSVTFRLHAVHWLPRVSLRRQTSIILVKLLLLVKLILLKLAFYGNFDIAVTERGQPSSLLVQRGLSYVKSRLNSMISSHHATWFLFEMSRLVSRLLESLSIFCACSYILW